MKRRVAIFTTFFDASPAYSLNQVVQDQIRMLIFGGYKPTVIVVEGFQAKEMYAHPDVTLKHIPHFPVSNEGFLPEDYRDLIGKTRDALLEILKEIDVVITHDVIYQPAHLIHNLASREVAEMKPELQWLHWIHSATSQEVLCQNEEVRPLLKRPFPNALICYPNWWDIPRVAKNYGWEEDKVKWVPHPIDVPSFLGFHEASAELSRKHMLLYKDVLAVYPARLDRGKQVEHIIKLLGAMKKKGRSVGFAIFDFHSTGGDKVIYREELREIAKKWNVGDDVIWISDDERFKYDAPRQMIRDLMLISNLYVHPSVSETYSLATQEAALCKNQLVLNFDFPPMMSVYGKWPLYKKFSSAVNVVDRADGDTMWNWPDGKRMPYPFEEDEWYGQMASNVLYWIENNPVLMEQRMIRQERTVEHVFEKFLEPLLNR